MVTHKNIILEGNPSLTGVLGQGLGPGCEVWAGLGGEDMGIWFLLKFSSVTSNWCR